MSAGLLPPVWTNAADGSRTDGRLKTPPHQKTLLINRFIAINQARL